MSFNFRSPAAAAAEINANAPMEQLARIIANIGNDVSPKPITLQLRTVRGVKDSEGNWHHEYRLEIYDPYGNDDCED